MNGLLLVLNVIAGIILVAHAFTAIVHMGRSTRHMVRAPYVAIGVAAIVLVLAPAVPAEWRHHAYFAIVLAYAALVIFDQRKRQVISLGS